LGTIALFATIAVAGLGLVLSAMMLDNALYGRVRDRTLFGVVLMAVGFLGPVVALVALSRRRTLRQLGYRQWGALALFPGSFLVVWAIAFLVYAIADPVGKPIIPHTPTFIIRFDAEGRPQFHVRGWFSGGHESGPAELRVNGVLVSGSYDFDFHVFPDKPGIRALTFTGEIKCAAGKRVELRGELVLAEKFWLRVEKPVGAVLLIDDQPRESPILLEAGNYRVAVRGLPGE